MPAAFAGRPELERLRAFCRARGIELPYRQTLESGARAAGLAQAFERVARGERSQLVILISDLEGVLDDAKVVRRALLLLRRQRHHVFVIAPAATDLTASRRTEAGSRVARVLRDEEQRRLDHARRELGRLGLPLVVATPEENADGLVRRLLRARGPARRTG